MATSLHVSLPDELRRFVDQRTDGRDIYSTPSEYIRDLIRKDMQENEKLFVYQVMLQGSDEADRGEFVQENFMDDLIARYSK